MSKPAYQFRSHYGVQGLSPQIVGERLSEIADEHGEVTPGLVVEDARPEEAPLHPAFTWDDEIAAERYREDEARRLIRSVVIVNPEEDEAEDTEYASVRTLEPEDVPAFVSVARVRGEACYIPTTEAMANEDTRESVLESARSGLISWRKRYAGLSAVARSELAKVIEAIDEAINVPA